MTTPPMMSVTSSRKSHSPGRWPSSPGTMSSRSGRTIAGPAFPPDSCDLLLVSLSLLRLASGCAALFSDSSFLTCVARARQVNVNIGKKWKRGDKFMLRLPQLDVNGDVKKGHFCATAALDLDMWPSCVMSVPDASMLDCLPRDARVCAPRAFKCI